METKRLRISKKTRFEVFKRDSFTCQYCGKKAPDVILHIDHIKPVSKGGKNSILNYVTSCVDCNLGKGARELSDSSALDKSRKQAEVLQARREQIEMIRDWHLSLIEDDNLAADSVDELFTILTNGERSIREEYKTSHIVPLIKKYGLSEVMEALRAGSESYKNPEKALSKLSGICFCRNNKEANKRMHLLNIMNLKFSNFTRSEASDILKAGFGRNGYDFYNKTEILICSVSGSWYQVKHHFFNLICS